MKDIPGFEGRYAITEDGKVWSYPNNIKYNKHKDGHFLAIRNSGFHTRYGKKERRGYKRVCLSKEGKSVDFYIHRLVAEAFIPNPNGYREVNHIDGNPSNNTISNLEWCDRKYNVRHTIFLGRTTRGEKDTQCKLSEKEVREIRRLRQDGYKQKYIANKYGISESCVNLIHHRKSWAWLV